MYFGINEELCIKFGIERYFGFWIGVMNRYFIVLMDIDNNF